MAMLGFFAAARPALAADCNHADLQTTLDQAWRWFARDEHLYGCWGTGIVIGDMLCGQARDTPAFELMISEASPEHTYHSRVEVYSYTSERGPLVETRYCNLCADDCSTDPSAFDGMFPQTVTIPSPGGMLYFAKVADSMVALFQPNASSEPCQTFDLGLVALNHPVTVIGSDGDDTVIEVTESYGQVERCGVALHPFARTASSSIDIELGAGDDTVQWPDPEPVVLRGGPGSDWLFFQSGVADGGDGNDVLKGGQDSTLLGGSGDDALCGRVNRISAMDGGDGWDTICLDADVVTNAEEITCDPCPNGF
jgi:hypothetical protein